MKQVSIFKKAERELWTSILLLGKYPKNQIIYDGISTAITLPLFLARSLLIWLPEVCFLHSKLPCVELIDRISGITITGVGFILQKKTSFLEEMLSFLSR